MRFTTLRRRHGIGYAIVALLFAALLFAGCGGSDSDDSASGGSTTTASSGGDQKVKSVAIATPEKGNDYGWNQQGIQSAKKATEATGSELTIADGIGYDNTDSALRQQAQGGANFIIAWASGYGTIAQRVAQQFKVPVLITDSPKAIKPGLVGNITFASGGGAYLAGALAAKMSKTGTVGIASSADNLNWNNMSGAFAAGAKATDPQIKVRMAQIGEAAYADAAGGKRVTRSLIASGADVIFGLGDGASFGFLQAVETASTSSKPVWFIDVIGDKTKLDKKGVLLSSVLWDPASVYERAIKDINDGNFGKEDYVLDSTNGISLLKTDHIPDDVWSELEALQKKVESGEITVEDTPTKADVQKALKG